MKIPAILTCLLAVFLAAVPVRQARAAEVSFDVFYNNLADDGDWYNTPEYGYVWQPSIAYKNDKWRPYTDGYWAQTDDGWTWVSYENFGWATYHYGRWTRLKDVGWAWVPGYDWGPGWVSWRTSDDYVGWAPLPPKAEQGVYEGRVVDRAPAEAIDYNDVEPEDYSPNVDVQYDIGPQNYCFVDTHNFGAPVLGEVCLPPERNFVIIENTVNVTNIYRRRGPDNFVVFNRGPDYNFISAHSERPIQQLRIDRHDDIGFLQNGIHGGGNANQVRNGVFSVAAPSITRGPINFAQVKPVKVKETIARPEVIHGWSHAGGDPATIQRLHEKFQQQAQAAPPPHRETGPLPPRPPVVASTPPAAAQPFNAPSTGPHQPLTDADRAARRDAAQRAHDDRQKSQATGQQPPANVPPPHGPAANAPVPNGQPLTPEERKAARRERKQQEGNPQAPTGAQSFANPGQPPAANAPAPNAPAPDADKAARRAQRQQEKGQQAQQQQQAAQAQQQQAQQAQQQQAQQAAPEREARRAQRQQQQEQPQAAPRAPQPQAQPETANPDREARRAQRQQEQSAASRATQPQPQPEAAANPDREARRAQRQQEQAAPRAPQPQAQPEAANPDREARRAQRQQEQAAAQRPPQPQAQPEAPHRQPENTPQGKEGDDGKKHRDQPSQ